MDLQVALKRRPSIHKSYFHMYLQVQAPPLEPPSLIIPITTPETDRPSPKAKTVPLCFSDETFEESGKQVEDTIAGQDALSLEMQLQEAKDEARRYWKELQVRCILPPS